MRKDILLLSLLVLSFFIANPSFASAQSVSSYACYNSTVSLQNFTLSGSSSSVLTNYQFCPLGCNGITGNCNGNDPNSSINGMWITFAIGAIFLVLGTVLGIPTSDPSQNSREGNNDIKSRFNTTIVIKYVFFFGGFLFMYLALSMSYRAISIFGGDANILGASNTTIMIMAIVFVLFLFIFIIELFFTSIKSMWESRQAKKWANEEEE